MKVGFRELPKPLRLPWQQRATQIALFEIHIRTNDLADMSSTYDYDSGRMDLEELDRIVRGIVCRAGKTVPGNAGVTIKIATPFTVIRVWECRDIR